jgi:hypothetical protein
MTLDTFDLIILCTLVAMNYFKAVEIMIKYGVFDNNRAASTKGFPFLKGKCWNNHLFDTFEEALKYARMWLGPQWGGSPDGTEGIVLKLNESYDYDGYGAEIVIREVEV